MKDEDGNAPPPPYRAHCEFDENMANGPDVADAQQADEYDDEKASPPSYRPTSNIGAMTSDWHGQSEKKASHKAYSPFNTEKEKKVTATTTATTTTTGWGPFKRSIPVPSIPSPSTTTPMTEKKMAVNNYNFDCGHWAVRGCSMTSGPHTCCVCLDKRPIRADGRYPAFIDGQGGRPGSTTRWAHYCPSCAKAEQALGGGGYRSGNGTSREPPAKTALEDKQGRREAARQAEMQKQAREKTKVVLERDRLRLQQQQQQQKRQQQHQRQQQQRELSTPQKKSVRQAQHAIRMKEQERAAAERRGQETAERRQSSTAPSALALAVVAAERQAQEKAERRHSTAAWALAAASQSGQSGQSGQSVVDFGLVQDERTQVQLQVEQLEAELEEKRARLQRLDAQYRLHEPHDLHHVGVSVLDKQTGQAGDITHKAYKASGGEDKNKHTDKAAGGLTEKQAAALAEYERQQQEEADTHRWGMKTGAGGGADDDYEVVGNDPFLSTGAPWAPRQRHPEKTGGGIGSGNNSSSSNANVGGSSNWLGRVFGRGREKGDKYGEKTHSEK